MFLLAGQAPQDHRACWRKDLDERQWTAGWERLPDMPAARQNATATVRVRSIYVIGGTNDDGPSGILSYDIDKRVWRVLNASAAVMPALKEEHKKTLINERPDSDMRAALDKHLTYNEDATWMAKLRGKIAKVPSGSVATASDPHVPQPSRTPAQSRDVVQQGKPKRKPRKAKMARRGADSRRLARRKTVAATSVSRLLPAGVVKYAAQPDGSFPVDRAQQNALNWEMPLMFITEPVNEQWHDPLDARTETQRIVHKIQFRISSRGQECILMRTARRKVIASPTNASVYLVGLDQASLMQVFSHIAVSISSISIRCRCFRKWPSAQ
jgi:hypothetical protein